MECRPQAQRPQISWNKKAGDANSHSPHHQPIRRMSTSWSCFFWKYYYRTPHCPLQGGSHSFEGFSPLWPPLPDKTIKRLFSTSSNTLFPRFNMVSGYRSQIQLQQWGSKGKEGRQKEDVGKERAGEKEGKREGGKEKGREKKDKEEGEGSPCIYPGTCGTGLQNGHICPECLMHVSRHWDVSVRFTV